MDPNNPVVRLCIEGTRAEYGGRRGDAQKLYWQAWETAANDYERCIAAHYVARFQANPEETFRWNQAALNHAEAVDDASVKDFFPSLYLAMGQACEHLGKQAEARHYYDLAEGLGYSHQMG